jgi:hypothetical protein
MSDDNSFPLSLDYEGKHYDGMVTPSTEKSQKGTPVFFRVTLGDQLFAYLCCGDNGWKERNSTGQQKGLVTAIGNYIFDYYE